MPNMFLKVSSGLKDAETKFLAQKSQHLGYVKGSNDMSDTRDRWMWIHTEHFFRVDRQVHIIYGLVSIFPGCLY